jgi:DNA-binding transcriptional MerR regulator
MSETVKEDRLYYSIGELSEMFDVAPSLLRYWESEFDFIKPKRNRKGTRFYTSKDIDAIKKIHHLVKTQGYTLEGARKKLKTKDTSINSSVELIERLKHIKSFLKDLKKNL